MMDVTVKTLDGQNRSFSVPENITVRQFKEKIANSINIPADTQRLIFQGRVLHDEKLLKDYDVHGKVVHVVLRPPPSSGRPAGPDNATPSATPTARDHNSVVVGSFSLPSDIIDANMVQNIAQDAIRNMGDMGRNARVSTRTSTDGSAVDVHIHLGPVSTNGTTSEAQMRLNTARRMMRLAREALNQLENPDTAATGSSSTSSTSASSPAAATGNQPAVSTDSEPVTVSSTNQSTPTPMDTEEITPPAEPALRDGSGDASPATATSSTESTNQDRDSPPTGQSNASTQPPRGLVRPNISALGEILTEIGELNTRLQPHIDRFNEIVTADAEMDQNEQRENQRVCNTVSEAMHGMSHAYHAVSDLMVELGQPCPRQLYVTLAIAHPHTAVIQQAIPVQAQIQVGGSPRLIRRQFGPQATSTNTTGTSVSAANVTIPGMGVGVGSQTNTTTSTGTSTGPQPATASTGTQSSEARSQAAGAGPCPHHQHGDLSDDEMQRIQEQMSAGLQSVLGESIHQGNGTPENPYVFVEMGPDSMTVNSISAEVVTSSDPGDGSAPPPPTSTATASSTTTTTPNATATPGQGQTGLPGQQGAGMLPPNFLQNIVQQMVRQTAPGQTQRMQVNLGQVPPGMMGGAPVMMGGMPIGIRLGPRLAQPRGPRSESSGTQTNTAGGLPANSGTQTSAAPTSASGTQTASNASPNSTSGSTQTPGAPRAAAFVVPGMPGLAQNISPVDTYLPCSSRHFLSQHARGIINQGTQNNDTALADMVTNLMSGLLGGRPQTGAPTTGTATASTGTPGSTATNNNTTGTPLRPTGYMPGMRGGPQLRTGPGLSTARFQIRGMFPGRIPLIPGMRAQFTPNQPRPGAPGTQPGQRAGSNPQAGGTGGGTDPPLLQMLQGLLASSTGGGNQSSNANTGTTTSAAGSTTSGTGTPVATGNQATQPSSTTSGTSGTPGSTGSISDETFMRLLSDTTGYMFQAANGQAPRQTVSDFLRSMEENYSIPSGDDVSSTHSFINDAMSCVFSNLQMADLISIFNGQSQHLNLVQRPLREFLSTRVLEGSPAFPDNIRTSVERLVQSMQPELQSAVDAAQPRPHIDLLATLSRFLNVELANMINLVMNSREGDVNFGSDLYASVRRMFAWLLVLNRRCLGGMDAVQGMVSNRLEALMGGLNPMIQGMLSSMVLMALETFLPTINVSEGEVAHYIVYQPVGGKPSGSGATPTASKAARATTPKGSGPDSNAATTSQTSQASAQSTVGKATQATCKVGSTSSSANAGSQGASATGKRSPTDVAASAAKRISKPTHLPARENMNGQPMETSSPTSTSSPGASESEMPSPLPAQEVKGAASACARKPARDSDKHPSPSGAQAVSEDWQTVVPAEWVPVITRDIETQKKESSQRPHSDVYLQGMPPKRRKLMTHARPQGDLSNTAEVLPDSIRRAVAAAAVEPISSLENLSSELNNETELQEAFQTQIHSTISGRLNEDQDFKSDRFPNTQELYHKSAGKK